MNPADLVECSNCESWFAAASADDLFYHVTSRCCRDLADDSDTGE